MGTDVRGRHCIEQTPQCSVVVGRPYSISSQFRPSLFTKALCFLLRFGQNPDSPGLASSTHVAHLGENTIIVGRGFENRPPIFLILPSCDPGLDGVALRKHFFGLAIHNLGFHLFLQGIVQIFCQMPAIVFII